MIFAGFPAFEGASRVFGTDLPTLGSGDPAACNAVGFSDKFLVKKKRENANISYSIISYQNLLCMLEFA